MTCKNMSTGCQLVCFKGSPYPCCELEVLTVSIDAASKIAPKVTAPINTITIAPSHDDTLRGRCDGTIDDAAPTFIHTSRSRLTTASID